MIETMTLLKILVELFYISMLVVYIVLGVGLNKACSEQRFQLLLFFGLLIVVCNTN